MTKLLLVDLDGTIREPLSGEKFIQHPQDQRIIKGATQAIALPIPGGFPVLSSFIESVLLLLDGED